jgi:cell division protein FtsW
LTAFEPDVGAAGLLAAVLCSMLFVGGVKIRYALPVVVCAAPLVALVAYSKLGYIQARVADWWGALTEGVSSSPLGAGYQNTQAMMAQGSGGVWGTGLGQGQSKLLYLPEAHNDFVFAVIGEELGLVGTLTIVALFALLVITGWRVARRAPDMLGTLIALGVTFWIGLQAAINIAVVTQSMPNKGMPLPLISYGGSALVFTLAGLGLLLNVAAHPPSDSPPEELGATPRRKSNARSLAENAAVPV